MSSITYFKYSTTVIVTIGNIVYAVSERQRFESLYMSSINSLVSPIINIIDNTITCSKNRSKGAAIIHP